MKEEDIHHNKIVRVLLDNEAFRILTLEFIATTVLLFIANGIGTVPPFQGHPSEPNRFRLVYVALTVYVLICFFGPLTGCHINPAVSLGVYLNKPKQHRKMGILICYWIGQFAGGLLGVILAHSIYGNGGAVFTEMPDILELGKMCLEELIATLIFIFFILMAIDEEVSFADGEGWVHIIIGIVYYFCLTFSSQLHHLNPAVTFGLQFEAMIRGTSASALPAIIALFIVQFFGGFLAFFAFRNTYVPALKSWRDK